jgi:hypothetical protein
MWIDTSALGGLFDAEDSERVNTAESFLKSLKMSSQKDLFPL